MDYSFIKRTSEHVHIFRCHRMSLNHATVVEVKGNRPMLRQHNVRSPIRIIFHGNSVDASYYWIDYGIYIDTVRRHVVISCGVYRISNRRREKVATICVARVVITFPNHLWKICHGALGLVWGRKIVLVFSGEFRVVKPKVFLTKGNNCIMLVK